MAKAPKSNIEIQAAAAAKLKTQMQRFVTDSNMSQGQYMYRQTKLIAIQLQDELNKSIDKPMPFTQRAIRSGFDKIRPDVYESRIYVNADQARYLWPIIFPNKSETKFKPNSRAPLDNYGNIRGLKSGTKYVSMTLKNNKQALLTQGKKPKIIAIRGEIQHEQLFDYDGRAKSMMRQMIERMKKR